MKRKFKLSLSFAICYFSIHAQEAIVIVPTADLLGQSMSSILQKKTKKLPTQKEIIHAYDSMPEIPGDDNNCPRIYQLLFNERVNILDSTGCEVKIEVPYALYGNAKNGKLSGIYWTLKRNILLKENLTNKEFAAAVPPSMNETKRNQQTVVLKTPYFDPATNMIYSAGTKFNYQSQSNKGYRIIRYDPKKKKLVVSTIAAHSFIPSYSDKTQKDLQNAYVQLLRQWAQSKTPPPYVWGGASFNHTKSKTIKSGFDCSGAIIRSSQACSIPFFYKNSSAMHYHLKNYERGLIEDGDIIWFNGHVMIISNVKENLIIESRGYSSGFGKLHEIPLAKLCKNIKTCDQLLDVCRQKQPLELLDKEGKVSCTIKEFKFLRYSSLWK